MEKRRIASILLVLVMLFTLIPMQTQVSASTKKETKKQIVLEKKSIKLSVGKTSKVKVKKVTGFKNKSTKASRFKYKSSNTKVATVSSKGVIKAKKKGTATITVYFKEGKTTYKAKLKVTVTSKKSSKNDEGTPTNDYDGDEDWWGEPPEDHNENIQ